MPLVFHEEMTFQSPIWPALRKTAVVLVLCQIWWTAKSNILSHKPKCSDYIGGLMFAAACKIEVDPHTFGLADPPEEKKNIKNECALKKKKLC